MTSALAIQHAARVLQAGGVIAYPTEGVFGLGCLPHDFEAVQHLLSIKGRRTQAGLILVAADIERLAEWIAPDKNELKRLTQKKSVPTTWIVALTDDNSTLISEINSYESNPGTRCLCCAIHKAKLLLTDPSKNNFIVLMSDGSAEKTTPSSCPSDYTGDPKQDAINEACDAYENHNIKVYSIGFGQDADNVLLQNISNCGNGKWASSTNYTGLEDIYKEFAKEIGGPSVVYDFQTITSTNINSTLHSNSYILLNRKCPHRNQQKPGCLKALVMRQYKPQDQHIFPLSLKLVQRP